MRKSRFPVMMERELVIGTGNRERSALKNPGEPGPWKCRHGNERVEVKRMKMGRLMKLYIFPVMSFISSPHFERDYPSGKHLSIS